MATTIDQGFRQLRSNLEITSLQAATVSGRQGNVRTAVASELTVLSDFLTGSYMRDTMIAPLSEADVDIFVVLDPNYYETNGQAKVLDRVKRAIERTYGRSEISRNGHAVTIYFSDFEVDVVPAFHQAYTSGFYIPNTYEGTWISTDPRRHVDLWREANRVQNGAFVPLVKMLKAWNKSHSQLLSSFHLETMIWEVFRYRAITDYAQATLTFFQHAQSLVQSGPRPDPAGFGAVGTLSYTDREGVLSRMRSAQERANAAITLAAQYRTAEAFARWRVLFGERYFPTYG